MANWYDKYLSVYEKPFCEVSQDIIDGARQRLAALQCDEPLISIVVIAYNEERRLASCLWSLSEMYSDYPLELFGVNNNSKDRTEDVFKAFGLPYHTELRQSPGFARQCGLIHAKGKYYFCIDADTCYPPQYVNLMMKKLQKRDVACVSSFWSFFSDKNHSKIGLHCYEFLRDCFLFFQHFNRPELCVRGMVFAFKIEYARQVQIRTDIRRGEDGSLALSLKKFGRISFLYNRKARPVTGYGTIGNQSIWKSFWDHAKIQGRGLTRIFHKTDYYEDTEDNMVKNK